MKIVLAFAGILMIWSTTPLAIQWSSEGMDFLFSVALRMTLAALLSTLIVLVLERRLPLSLSALGSYMAGGIAIFGAMSCVYWAAQYVPSGLIAIVYGMAPVITGVMAYIVLGEGFNLRQLSGLLLSLAGLIVVYAKGLPLGGGATAPRLEPLAMLGVLASVGLYSLSGVVVKKLQAEVTPLQQTSGTLLMSALAYVILYVTGMINAPDINGISVRAALSLAYLVVICSVLGFVLYYYALKKTSASAVALVTLITPVLALGLGVLLNGEQIGWETVLGTGFILLGLLAYLWPALVAAARSLYLRLITNCRPAAV